MAACSPSSAGPPPLLPAHRGVRGRSRVWRARRINASPTRAAPPCERLPADLRFARTCYDHLAGTLAVAIRDALLDRELVQETGIEHLVTERGADWLTAQGVDVAAAHTTHGAPSPAAASTRRAPASHLAGALGAALLDRFVARGWLLPGRPASAQSASPPPAPTASPRRSTSTSNPTTPNPPRASGLPAYVLFPLPSKGRGAGGLGHPPAPLIRTNALPKSP